MEQATTSKVVSVTRESNGVALIHLNRPPANSYDRGLIDDLNAAIDEIRFDESIGAAVLMSDLPKFFSAGADINMFRTVSSKARAMTILHMHEVLLKMEHTPKVFIAAIGGHWAAASRSRSPLISDLLPRASTAWACPKSRWACCPAMAAPSGCRD